MDQGQQLRDMIDEFDKRKNTYTKLFVRAVIKRNDDTWVNILSAVLPLSTHGDYLDTIVDYGNFSVVKQCLTLDTFQSFIKSIFESKSFMLANRQVTFGGDITLQLPIANSSYESFIPSHGQGNIEKFEVDWPMKAFMLGPLGVSPYANIRRDSLIRKGKSVFANEMEAIDSLFPFQDFANNWGWYGKMAIFLPDYRARFTKLTIGKDETIAHIEPGILSEEDLYVRFYSRGAAGLNDNLTEFPLKAGKCSTRFRIDPYLIVALLFSKDDELIDSIEYNAYDQNAFREWIEYSGTENELMTLASLGENEFLEYKREIGNKDEFLETVVSFANTKGGQILLGVDDNGQLVGAGSATKARILDLVTGNLDPFVNVGIREIEVEKRPIFIISVPQGSEKPYFLRRDGTPVAYVRRNGSDYAMTKSQLDEAYRDRNSHSKSPFG